MTTDSGSGPAPRPILPPPGAKVLVTGAGGFVGTPCCDHLTSLGVEVHGVSRQPADMLRKRESRPGMFWWQSDLLNPELARALVRRVRPTHLLHLAWASGADGFKNSPENYRWIGPSLELLRAFVDVGGRRVVTSGTGAEYDWTGGICWEEKTPLKPSLTYGLCKRTFFELSSWFLDQHEISNAWGRLFFLYGPREEPRRLLASTILDLLEGKTARCNYSRFRRDYLYIEDAAEGLVRLLFSEVRGPVHLASGWAPSLGQLVTKAANLIGRPEAVELGGLPEGDHDHLTVVADITRARLELGWEPRWSLDDGLARTVEWWRRSGELGDRRHG